MSEVPAWAWPGARWWRCDLHLHTPASEDYQDPNATAQAIVDRAVGVGLDLISVTDHDSGQWIDEIAAAAGRTGLALLPGVEVTSSERVHLLLLGRDDHSTRHVDDLLSLLAIPPDDRGKKQARSSKTVEQVMKAAREGGWLCIAPHADAPATDTNPSRGALLTALDDDRQRLRAILDDPTLVAAEIVGDDPAKLAELRGLGPNRARRAPGLALVHFSDAHKLDRIGQRSTWIKMTRPDREGLALALSDGDRSVQEHTAGLDPNRVPPRAIEKLTVSELKYAGRGAPLEVPFNPWLTVIIGGRGAGKSTLVNALRLALNRAGGTQTADFARFNRVGSRGADGALTDATVLTVDYRRDGHRLRAGWSTDGSAPALQEPDAAGWAAVDGAVTQRTPARIIGQGELAELAADTRQLLALVDDTAEVDRRAWQEEWDAEHARFLSLRARAREQRSRIPDRSQLLGEETDLVRAIAVLERDEHRDALREYQRVRQQEAALEGWRSSVSSSVARLREVLADVAIDDPPVGAFDREDIGEPEVRSALEQRAAVLRAALDHAERAVVAVAAAAGEDPAGFPSASWIARRDEVRAAYETLTQELAGTGADPSRYGELVSRRQSLTARLESIDAMEAEATRLEAEAEVAVERCAALRDELTERRRAFLASTSDSKEIVRFELAAAGDREGLADELRDLLLGETSGDAHAADIKRCVDLAVAGANALAGARELKRVLRNVAEGRESDFGGWFRRRLEGLKPEALDRLDAWFPADRLIVEYQNAADTWQPITQGSAGQRNAAILAFLLSYGEEPLVIDQPENDLDNALITDLVVRQLREIRRRRQLIVVTHNPNIVVNADADLIISLTFDGGRIEFSEMGGLQEQKVRDEVCRIVEGGREAFESRYERIGQPHV